MQPNNDVDPGLDLDLRNNQTNSSGQPNNTSPKIKEELGKLETFEDVLQLAGGFGRFQIIVLILLLGPEIPAAFVAFSPVFIGREPASWTTTSSTCSNDIMVNGSVVDFDVCSCNNRSLIQAADGTDSIITEWNLICEKSWVSDFITSTQMFGMLVGSLSTSQLADWFGRKYVYIGVCGLMTAGQLISAASFSPYIYAIGRFLCGAGVSGFMSASTVYPMEFLGPKYRQMVGSVGPWGWGIMLFAFVGYLIQPWREFLWITTLPFMLVFITVPFLPESPRFLLLNNKTEQLEKILKRISIINGKSQTFSINLEKLELIAEAENSNTKTANKRLGYSSLFRSDIRRKTIVLSAIWFAWALVYYGLTFNIKNLRGNIYINTFLLGLSDAIGYPLALLVNNRIGRRKSLILFIAIAAIFLISVAGLELFYDSANAIVIIVLCLLGKLGTAGARSSARLLTGESFPTQIRSMGYGLTGVFAGVGGILAPQLVYLGAQWWRPLPFVTFAVISMLGSILALKIPETAGESLAEKCVEENVQDEPEPTRIVV